MKDNSEYSDISDSSDLEEDYDEDFEESSQEEAPGYTELNQEAILKCIEDEIEKVTCFTDVGSAEARCLLQCCQWNSFLVVETLTEGGCRKKKIYEKAGIQMKSPLKKANHPKFDEFECEICCDAVSIEDVFNLECGHVFCKGCLKQFITTRINNRANVCCPGENCVTLLSSEAVLSLLDSEKLRSSYYRLLAQSYVESNPLVSWCPGPDCGLAFKSEVSTEYKVECSKGHRSCFKCQMPWHDPLDCDLLKKWLKKITDDSETANWITYNTKECPRCKASIEKSGGCDHMNCWKCKHDFCWICLDSFEDGHICQPREESRRDEEGRAALKSYVQYFDR